MLLIPNLNTLECCQHTYLRSIILDGLPSILCNLNIFSCITMRVIDNILEVYYRCH